MVEGIVSFGEWEKIDLRVGEIIEIDDVPGADKLYKLKVDLGTETRTVVAGLKQHYTKDELDGKRIILFCNLEPRKLKSIESQGMVLAAVNDDHSSVKLIEPDGDIDLGAKVS